MLKIAIDLLWVRPNKVGGIEAYIRNLLDGFCLLEDDYIIYLLLSKDNIESFSHYDSDKRIELVVLNIYSNNVIKRIVWQNLNLSKEIKKLNVDLCFEPYYCKPILGNRKIRYVTTIHDLQALHYPQYFSRLKVMWMKFSWWNAVHSSRAIIAISEYVKNDILNNYHTDTGKIHTIYNPIILKDYEVESYEYIEEKYNVERYKYFFTVSSLLPHKNIITLVRVFYEIKKENVELPCKLIVSGVGGKSRDELERLIDDYGLNESIILTEFISNSERNTLYKYAKAFLFPSIFEGFGMPPVEAMYLGTPVITTKETSLYEVTQGCANYVDNPTDIYDWIDKMKANNNQFMDFSCYDIKIIAKQYFDVFDKIKR